MAKMDLPDPTSKCEICGINQYPPENKPVIWPCNIGLFRESNLKVADRGVCPFEKAEEQYKSMKVNDWEKIAGLLGTMHGEVG